LEDLLVSSFQSGGNTSTDLPIDQFSLNFAKITYDYLAQDEKGMTKTVGKVGYDLKAAKKL
jgi:type VI secretion system secreted protein Hcp